MQSIYLLKQLKQPADGPTRRASTLIKWIPGITGSGKIATPLRNLLLIQSRRTPHDLDWTIPA